MGLVKNRAEVEGMRLAGRITAQVCDRLVSSVFPGMTTAELDRLAAGLIREYGGKSAFLGYRGFPASICVSINEEVVHGIPGARRIKMGDIVSLDVGVLVDSFYGDMAKTIMIGGVASDVVKLVSTAEKALYAGIEKAVAGNRLSDISNAIENCANDAGFSVVRQFVGHGIGRSMHEEPQIPNFGLPGKGMILKESMMLAIEPMINMGGSDVEVLSDGWTAVTCDRKCSAHFEHTVAVGKDRAVVLTSL